MKFLPQQNIVPNDSTAVVKPIGTTIGEILVPTQTLNTIPEIPERFRVKKTYVRKKKIIPYTPSAEDSVNYNLLVRPNNDASPIYNNVVSDYLNPIERSDKQWINTDVSASKRSQNIKVAKQEIASNELNTTLDNLALQADSLLNEEYSAPKDSLVTNIVVQDNIKPNNFLKTSDKDVVSGLLIFAIAVVGFLRITNFKYIKELLSSLIYSQSARKLTAKFSTQNQTPSFILNVLFVMNSAIFVFLTAKYYKLDYAENYGLWIIPLTMLIVLIYFATKVGVYQLLGFIFDKSESTNEYLLIGRRHSKIGSLLLLPIITIITYINLDMVGIIIKFGGFVMLSLYLIQITRGLRIILTNITSLFYLFLYLCALEIMPLLIMYSIIRGA